MHSCQDGTIPPHLSVASCDGKFKQETRKGERARVSSSSVQGLGEDGTADGSASDHWCGKGAAWAGKAARRCESSRGGVWLLGVRSDRDEWDAACRGTGGPLRAPDETSSSLAGWKLRPRIWVTPFEAKALPTPPAIGWRRLSRTNRGRRGSLQTHSPGVVLLPRPRAFAWVLRPAHCPLPRPQTVVPGCPSSPSETPVRSSLLPWPAWLLPLDAGVGQCCHGGNAVRSCCFS